MKRLRLLRSQLPSRTTAEPREQLIGSDLDQLAGTEERAQNGLDARQLVVLLLLLLTLTLRLESTQRTLCRDTARAAERKRANGRFEIREVVLRGRLDDREGDVDLFTRLLQSTLGLSRVLRLGTLQDRLRSREGSHEILPDVSADHQQFHVFPFRLKLRGNWVYRLR